MSYIIRRSIMKQDNPIVKFANVLGQVISFFTVILWLLCLLNTGLSGFVGGYFLGEATGVLEYIKYWATLVALALSGFEFATRRIWLLIIYIVVVAACVILLCFPGTFNSLAGMVLSAE